MAGYIGSKASVVSSGAERKKTFAITTTTTALTGLVYTPTKVHVFHNGVRLVDGTDFTATNSTSITLTVAAESGDQVVVVSYASFQTSDTVSASAGGTFAGNVAFGANATFGDNDKAIFGAGSDLEIYSDGTHGIIKESGSGDLLIYGNNLRLGNADGSELYILGNNNAEVQLRHNNSTKLATTSTGISVTGTVTADGLTLGANNANSPQILFENSDGVTGDAAISTYDDSLGTMLVMGSNFYINSSGSESRFNTSEESSAVLLNRNGDLNLLTGGTGATATIRLKIDSSGKVGIGTSSPTTDGLTVKQSGSAFTPSSQTVALFQRNSATGSGAKVCILSGNNSAGDLNFGDAEDEDIGMLRYDHSSNAMTFTTNTAERMRIDSSGRFMVGKSDPTFGNSTAQDGFLVDSTNNTFHNQSDGSTPLSLNRRSSTGGLINFWYNTGLKGSISTNGSSVSYNTSSDYRLKTDAQPLTGASARVQALNPVNFEWIADGTRVDGFLAHEAATVVPESVTGTKDAMMDEEYEVTPAVLDDDGNETTAAVMGTRSVPDMQGIDQAKIVPLLTAALQEALTKIDDMETRLAALEGN